jgi:hypothetical protein
LYHGLKAVFSFRQAPGGDVRRAFIPISFSFCILVINKIAQAGRLTAIASAAVGGHPDSDESGRFLVISITLP